MSMTEGANTPRPLSVLPVGGQGVVHSLNGGRDFCSRVANLGFTAGAAITVVQNYGHGPMLVALRGTLVALGRTEATNVVVRTMGEGE
ncbi:MAG: FeoA family protein [Chloroflexi bacterium]|nr:FeoA family protein [Chloroflexota bacterium]